MKNKLEFTILDFEILLNNRLDKILAHLLHQHSRTFLKKLILSKKVFVNNKICNQPDTKIFYKDTIFVQLDYVNNNFNKPEPICLNIVYEDNDILIINKQDNFVVHPGSGNMSGTLLNALLYRSDIFLKLPRSGIVHRLDKNTTGLMVIAKSILAYTTLVNQIKLRKVVREYQAIVHGKMIAGGTIVQPITRHPIKRICMKVDKSGKKAITHYRIIKRFNFHTHLRIILETGRTHQIRVHMLHINFPIIGDKTYKKFKFYKNVSSEIFEMIKKFPRQALHASKLSLYHPITGYRMEWFSKLPNDMLNLIKFLNKN